MTPSLRPTVLATGVILIIVSLASVTLRCLHRVKQTKRIHAEDYLCLAGAATGIVSWALIYATVTKGLDKHSWDILPDIFTPTVLQLQAAQSLLSALAHFLVKASLLAFFLRSLGPHVWVRRLCYALLFLAALSYFSYGVVILSLCAPRRSESWNADILLPRCARASEGGIAVAVCSVVVNIAMLCIPVPAMRKLAVQEGEEKKMMKWGLAAVFLVGLSIVITSVVNLAYRIVVVRGADPVWNGVNVGVASYVEIFATIIISSLPVAYATWPSVVDGVRTLVKRARTGFVGTKGVIARAKVAIETARGVTDNVREAVGRARAAWKLPKVSPHRRGRSDTEPVYSYPRQAPAVCGRCGQSCLYCAQSGRLTMTASSDQKLASLIIPLFSEQAAATAGTGMTPPGASGPRLTGLGASGSVL
ncbi:hypothetical protein B0T14DRAFT_83442 [Immersiella caudata]|uniref:Rhodopsin domain-containing protein n=1 Tax=Immersiella caudata TaxID=314043 RepID=A0AA40CDX1_9PEZI|nr:hypothetical protein B0T14DRAFT_83442 [Immersiella caudata]